MANTDFTVFRTGWTLILNGRADRLYDAAAQATVQRGLLAEAGAGVFQGGLMAFLHPPHAALAGCGLGWMVVRWGLPAAFWLWTACSVAALVALLRLVRDVWHISGTVYLDPATGRVRRLVLNAAAPWAAGLVAALRVLLAPAQVAVSLGET